jgi:orotidine-5'-phosphate decarboxylase
VRRLAPVAVALDAPDIDIAAHWATLVTPHVSTVKIGLELYLRYGPDVVATVRGGSGVDVFLDLKLHDIPNTVAGAAGAVAKLHPEILTVHAAGGADMIKAAVDAAPATMVAAVTLLTSIGPGDLAELGVAGSVSDMVRRMAALAVSAGARGLVCSPQEVAAVRAEVGQDIVLITPGIRPSGADSHDQARVATPEEALAAGADLLVVGRPITRAPDPGAAAAAIAASLRRAVLSRSLRELKVPGLSRCRPRGSARLSHRYRHDHPADPVTVRCQPGDWPARNVVTRCIGSESTGPGAAWGQNLPGLVRHGARIYRAQARIGPQSPPGRTARSADHTLPSRIISAIQAAGPWNFKPCRATSTGPAAPAGGNSAPPGSVKRDFTRPARSHWHQASFADRRCVRRNKP